MSCAGRSKLENMYCHMTFLIEKQNIYSYIYIHRHTHTYDNNGPLQAHCFACHFELSESLSFVSEHPKYEHQFLTSGMHVHG
jgi:hypothetical protein